MARRKRSDDHENLERWLLTYADLITLLLAFFIVMYSMSRIDAKKFGKMSEALSGVLKGGTTVIKHGDDVGALPGHGVLKTGHLKSLGKEIEKSFQKLGKESEINVEISERGLVIHVMESALFDEGKADLKLKAQETLDVVARHIRNLDNHIRVEGHTDNKPINTIRFPSNWELSSVRATEVLRYLSDNHRLEPRRLSALGFGEYRPISPNNSDENRAKNRRVDIIILTMEMTASEPTSEFY
ncbi:MAG: OmpA family protein [Candidatus Zixiibacteriota bacterium]|nr:MAG: OmpA family protein [candidate division Zixibacteria bacterium]